MTEFIQLHVVTSYPPSNLNRDDLGRPKTALFGGTNRLRVSSQSLKRAWRQSPNFEAAVGENKGCRTREVGSEMVYKPMIDAGVGEKKALAAAQAITASFGKADDSDKAKKMATKQLVHISPVEQQAIGKLVSTLVDENRVPTDEEANLLRHEIRAADIALFGRMIADEPQFNIEAAAQVAHAITVHTSAIEDDYFTAVDDLNRRDEDAGAGHVGEAGFGAGVFYLYLCIDEDRLIESLSGDAALAKRTLRGLTEAVCTIAPSGKQNSFGSRAYASFALAERGDQQPRSLSVAFLEPMAGPDYVGQGIAAITHHRAAFERAYGSTSRDHCILDVPGENGSLDSLLEFVTSKDGATS